MVVWCLFLWKESTYTLMLHVQRFSGKMHEGLNSGCIQVGNLYAQGQLWEGELLFGVFLSVLLEFAPCVWFTCYRIFKWYKRKVWFSISYVPFLKNIYFSILRHLYLRMSFANLNILRFEKPESMSNNNKYSWALIICKVSLSMTYASSHLSLFTY